MTMAKQQTQKYQGGAKVREDEKAEAGNAKSCDTGAHETIR
jgi:hypothetical protein